MTTNDWRPITELPDKGQKVVLLYDTYLLAIIPYGGGEFPKVVIAWQPWADPPAPVPDAFERTCLRYNVSAKDKSLAFAMWNAALAHAAATGRSWKWETFEVWVKELALEESLAYVAKQAFNAARERKEA